MTPLSAQGTQCLPITGRTSGWALPQRLAGGQVANDSSSPPSPPRTGPWEHLQEWGLGEFGALTHWRGSGLPNTQRPPCEGPFASVAEPTPGEQVRHLPTIQGLVEGRSDRLVVFSGSAAAHSLLLPRRGNKAHDPSCRGLARTTPAIPGFDSGRSGGLWEPWPPRGQRGPTLWAPGNVQDASNSPPLFLPLSKPLLEEAAGEGGMHIYSSTQVLVKLKSAILCLRGAAARPSCLPFFPSVFL